jgi:hypothetical protein
LLPAATASVLPLALALPTDNDGLLTGNGPGFYMYVDRNFEKQISTPWEGGQYGYVRGPVRHGGEVVMMAFHEGVDIAPVTRDTTGEPLDEVRAISPGQVVHCSLLAGASNYGRYVVIQHDLPDGSFFSLYAHLNRITVQPGQKVTMGTPIGILGYTGSGLDKRRAHVHLELNMMLSSRFNDWHTKYFRPNPNRHGIYNGLNMSGMDIARLYLTHQKNPALSLAEFVRSTPPAWKVVVPRKGELELVTHYPWLGQGVTEPSPSWEITLSESGLPLNVATSSLTVTRPKVTWVEDRKIPHGYHTRGHVAGSGGTGTLTAAGHKFVELLTGSFEAPSPAPTVLDRKKVSAKKP